jgi:hypothetical protein
VAPAVPRPKKGKVSDLNEVDIYNSIRAEIINNHTLMHWFTISVVIILFTGVGFVESRKSILSVFLPLLSVAWAAAMVRFDFFIHRQGAYLRSVEARLSGQSVNIPLWETWKSSLRSTQVVVPLADAIACAVIVVPTIYLLFGPSREYFQLKQWKGGQAYAWAVSALTILLLLSLTVIPKLADWGH